MSNEEEEEAPTKDASPPSPEAESSTNEDQSKAEKADVPPEKKTGLAKQEDTTGENSISTTAEAASAPASRTTPEASPAVPPEVATPSIAAAVSRPPPNDPSTFEDDGTFALPPGESYKVTPIKSEAANNSSTPTTPSSSNSKGAQILMSRFSNWRQKANENATILYQKAREAQEQASREQKGPLAALRHVAGVDFTVSKKESSDSYDSGEEEESSSYSQSGSEKGDDEEEDLPKPSQQPPAPASTETPVSMQNLPNLLSRQQVRSRVQNVASGVMNNLDSVATGFRGRYATGTEWDDNAIPPSPAMPKQEQAKQSQTALILKSRAAEHLQDILNSLEPYQYVMLLGAGRLQVNLKNPYVKNQGTYVDYLVAGGAADKSGVVAVGDSIVKVGPQDVRKHTIADVPSIIAKAKRPVVLVLTTGIELEVERITYLDLVVAMMHRIRYQDEKEKQKMIASAKKNKQQETEESKEGEGKDETTEAAELKIEEVGSPQEEASTDGAAFEYVEIPSIRSVEDYANPPQPPLKARQAYKNLVGKRCNDNFSVTQLSQVAASDDNFRAVLRNAFLCCAVDGRKFPFLGHHLSLEQEIEQQKQPTSPRQQPGDKNTPSALLMLFWELMNFSDLHGVTPKRRRREIAQRIAHKFFLPTKVKTAAGHRLEPPMFDFHHIVADSVLRHLEATLSNAQAEIPRDLFLEFQHSVADALCGTTFLLFLVSNQCARMRGYLRNVAPFVNVPLKPVFEALIAKTNPSGSSVTTYAGAKNYFLFVLIYLMQLEKDPTETLSTDDSTLLGRNGRRMVGAAGGLCCYLFIGRVIRPALEKLKGRVEPIAGESSAGRTLQPSECQDFIKTFEQFWEIFIAPGVGTLEHSWKSRETKEYLDILRTRFRTIRNDVLINIDSKTEDFEKQRDLSFTQKLLTDTGLAKEINELADNLLYDYATSTHSKFKEHLFHDWLCNELIKVNKEQREICEASEEVEAASELPLLPAGCIKRLLRKADLPVGVSPHKPIHSNRNERSAEEKNTPNYSNADCGIVFGSSVGSDLAAKMMSPAMEYSDIRRYSCQDLTLDTKGGLPDTFEDEVIPPTLESYAVLPPTRNTSFSEVTGNVCLSSDGWEVSMVNFMIPKADDGSGTDDDRSLYGVSLVFQRSSTARYHPRRISQTQLIREQEESSPGLEEKKTQIAENTMKPCIDDAESFPSPISFGKPSDDHWSTFTRSVKVSNDAPVFNGHLREKAWVDRVLQDEARDQQVPATVGVALISLRNVVVAMRQTLCMLLRDFSRMPDDEDSDSDPSKGVITCGALVDLLGNFSYQDVEKTSLRCILEPYIRAASSSWIERPLIAQKEEFGRHAGQQLITCLPPIPLALLFVATLLEQKIVLSSSRRSILFSATEALKGMLAPLKWCHLLVPLVPSALAKDLVQYPAPFILGMPSEDPGVMEIMNELPMDVTLVDLDVGRVILAPEFNFDSPNAPQGQNNEDHMRDLRSQMLYLAQILGSLFGAKLFRDAWSCDSPVLALGPKTESTEKQSDYDILRATCRAFVEELMAGVSSSCFWIEEEIPSGHKVHVESTVLFDEDRFFHIKRWREQHGFEHLLQQSKSSANRNLSLSMDAFNHVLESFVRCQSMNYYLSSLPREKMAFSF